MELEVVKTDETKSIDKLDDIEMKDPNETDITSPNVQKAMIKSQDPVEDQSYFKVPSNSITKPNDQKESDGLIKSEDPTSDNSCFKVPSDIVFKRPIFNKPIRNKSLSVLPQSPRDTGKSIPLVKTEEKEDGTKTDGSSGEVKSQDVNPRAFSKSPAQNLVEKSLPLPYKEPSWSGLPKHNYMFEVLKTGTIIETIPLTKPFLVFGRLAQCDVSLEHPSLSRYHCIVQYRSKSSEEEGEQGEEGFYAYDLSSTHGSYHNKHRMKPCTYYRMRVGHMLKFGSSSRMFILQGPDEDQEPESDLTITELKAEAAKRSEKLQKLETGEIEEEDRKRRIREAEEGSADGKDDLNSQENQQDGIDWGIGEDAVEEDEDDGGVNPFASLNEELYLNDPKKTLRGWFEREGYDLPEYITEDVSPGVYKCKVELPIPGPGGGPLVAIVEQKGRKKAAVIQCALEACRLLDKQGVLRQANHISHEKKKKDWAQNDYYDSDEDDFLDRTGDVQRKRMKRMQTASKSDGGGGSQGAETYESLMMKYKEITDELSDLEKKLADAEIVKRQAERKEAKDEEDDLDCFMKNLKSQVPDKHKRVNWKLRTVELKKEELRIRRIANIARPFGTPEVMPYVSQYDTKQSSTSPRKTIGSVFEQPIDRKKKMVHKAFLEDEPEVKVKLRRLDDDDDDHRPLVAIPYKTTKSSHSKFMQNVERRMAKESSQTTSSSSSRIGGLKILPSKTEGVEIVPSKPDDTRKDDIRLNESVVYSNIDRLNVAPSNSDARLNKNEIPSRTSENTSETSTASDLDDRLGKRQTSVNVDDKSRESETEGKQRSRKLGPTLPPEFLKARKQESSEKTKKEKSSKRSTPGLDNADMSKYETWVPPANQTGDGRTSLKDKFGY